MTRGKFYVAHKDGEIMTATGYTHTLISSKGGVIGVGLYRPGWARCWYVVERTSGMYICTGKTREDALANARHKADATYYVMTEGDKNPESAFRKARDRMSAYVKEQAEKPFE